MGSICLSQKAAPTNSPDVLRSHLQLVRMTMCSYVNIEAAWGSEEMLRTSPIPLPCNTEIRRSCERRIIIEVSTLGPLAYVIPI